MHGVKIWSQFPETYLHEPNVFACMQKFPLLNQISNLIFNFFLARSGKAAKGRRWKKKQTWISKDNPISSGQGWFFLWKQPVFIRLLRPIIANENKLKTKIFENKRISNLKKKTVKLALFSFFSFYSTFSNYSCIPNFFSNLNSNCSNLSFLKNLFSQ